MPRGAGGLRRIPAVEIGGLHLSESNGGLFTAGIAKLFLHLGSPLRSTPTDDTSQRAKLAKSGCLVLQEG